MVSGGMGWKLPVIADAVLEDKIRHADPIGTVELVCPVCTVPQPMTCSRFASGAFGSPSALHFVRPNCGGRRTPDKADGESILATVQAIDGGYEGGTWEASDSPVM